MTTLLIIIKLIGVGLSGVLVKETMALDYSLAPQSSVADNGGVMINNDGGDGERPDSIDDDDSISIVDFFGASNSITDERDLSSPMENTTTNDDDDDNYYDTFDIHNRGNINGQSEYYYNSKQNTIITTNYDDDQTYLDLFGERAKELLTQHLIPSTDEECRWNWRTGRCEPYCTCAIQFLWGDFHLGRSCRFRQSPPPTIFWKEMPQDKPDDESSWQEAWQEVWQTKLNVGTVDSSFLPPLFSTGQPAATDSSSTSTRDEKRTTCTLPPESRYIQIVNQLTNTLERSARLVERFQRIQKSSSATVNKGIVHGRHQWIHMRQKSCEIVKSKVEERAKERNQPVVLTRQGATWIRRVCGPTGNDSAQRIDVDEKDQHLK